MRRTRRTRCRFSRKTSLRFVTKAFLPGCSPTKLFLELYILKRATTQQGSFLPSFFSKKRKSRPSRPSHPLPLTNHNLKSVNILSSPSYPRSRRYSKCRRRPVLLRRRPCQRPRPVRPSAYRASRKARRTPFQEPRYQP